MVSATAMMPASTPSTATQRAVCPRLASDAAVSLSGSVAMLWVDKKRCEPITRE